MSKIKLSEGVEYINTLRSREFKITDEKLLELLKIPKHEKVEMWHTEADGLHIVIEGIIKEKI